MRGYLLSLGVIYLAVTLLSGCASWDSLKPGVDRACTAERCYVFGTQEQIDRHCRKKSQKWDNGLKVSPGDGYRARCCTTYHPARWRKFTIWISRMDADCIAHEEAHIEEYKSGRNEHWRVHDFGIGKKGKSGYYLEREK